MTNEQRKQVLEKLRKIDWLASKIRANTPGEVLIVPHIDAQWISMHALKTIALIEQSGERSEPTTRKENDEL